VEQKIGHYSFIGGVIIAIVLGLASDAIGANAVWLVSLLVLLGLVVGYLNVTGKETKEFLLVATVLVIVSSMAPGALERLTIGQVGVYLQNVLGQIMAFVVPATLVVALKEIWVMGQNPE
tara:strand:+ start:1069 stop:1428 length:360 start_codon:yes stop_codon:yes gene_type:complete